VRRNRLAVALGVLATLALFGAVARERHLRALAEAETRKAGAVEEFLLGVFAAADPFAWGSVRTTPP
jgi:eukaryotic-like serine/threonine-protein kinase